MISRIAEILRYRDFLYFLVVLDLKRRARQAFVGVAWVLLQPFALTLLFVLVFSRWYAAGGDAAVPYALFAYAGLVPWTLFSRSLQVGVPRLASCGSLLRKVHFPREILPVSSVCTAVFDAALAAGGLLALQGWYGVAPTKALLFLPAVVGLEMMLALGLTLMLSAMNVYYRDAQFALPFFLQAMLLATPIIYPASRLPEGVGDYLYLNPLTGITSLYRWMFLGLPLDKNAVETSVALSAAALAVGWLVFRRLERRFADVV